MNIRRASFAELPRITEIYAAARAFMRRAGNTQQWGGAYPSEETVREDIEKERLYVCEEDGELLGVFCYFFGEEPTYREIFDGEWLDASELCGAEAAEPSAQQGAADTTCSPAGAEHYGVMHRVAVAEHAHGRGVAAACFEFCLDRCCDLRIDTHRDNIPMQRALARAGFSRRGIIYLANGDERIAYRKAHGV